MKIHLKLRINKGICEGSLQLLKLIKHHNENKALIMQACTAFEPRTPATSVQCSTKWADEPTESWHKEFINHLLDEVILNSPHRSSVDDWFSKKTEFKEFLTDWT